jgi:hypothetical protein
MLVCLAAMSSHAAEKRVALVIGNSAYKTVGPLGNPVNDAAAVSALLKSAGFAAVEVYDAGLTTLRRAVADFSEAANDADMAVVYFAGHGIEVDRANYLIPVDAKLARDFDIADETVALDRVLQAIEPAKRLRLVILDACRNNLFISSMRRSTRSVGRGLVRVDPATADTLVAFAAREGTVADDGGGKNSPFTAALLKHLTTPGLDIRLALGRVRDEVRVATQNKQEPFVYGSLGGETVAIVSLPAIAPSGRSTTPASPADSDSAVRADYQLAERVGSREGWDAFLARYPSGYYADLARVQRGKLAVIVPPVPPAIPPAPFQPTIVPPVTGKHSALRGKEVWVSWNTKGEPVARRIIARLEGLGMKVLEDRKDGNYWNHDFDHSPQDAALAREVAAAVRDIYSFNLKPSESRSIPNLWIMP